MFIKIKIQSHKRQESCELFETLKEIETLGISKIAFMQFFENYF